jgi:hypothetical protein
MAAKRLAIWSDKHGPTSTLPLSHGDRVGEKIKLFVTYFRRFVTQKQRLVTKFPLTSISDDGKLAPIIKHEGSASAGFLPNFADGSSHTPAVEECFSPHA